MAVPGHRHERVAEEIRHELATMVVGELKDPRIEGLVTITEVRVTPNLKARARFRQRDGRKAMRQKKTIQGLAAAVSCIRHELTERIQLRRAWGKSMYFIPRSFRGVRPADRRPVAAGKKAAP